MKEDLGSLQNFERTSSHMVPEVYLTTAEYQVESSIQNTAIAKRPMTRKNELWGQSRTADFK